VHSPLHAEQSQQSKRCQSKHIDPKLNHLHHRQVFLHDESTNNHTTTLTREQHLPSTKVNNQTFWQSNKNTSTHAQNSFEMSPP
jgi:hypothetical protein